MEEFEDEVGYLSGFCGGGSWRAKKLDLPIFWGDNPDGWFMHAEQFFQFYRLTEEEQVATAVVSIDGDALLWYQWENCRRPISRWSEMKVMILRQFRIPPREVAQPLARGWGGVVEYIRRFIELLAPLEGIPETIDHA